MMAPDRLQVADVGRRHECREIVERRGYRIRQSGRHGGSQPPRKGLVQDQAEYLLRRPEVECDLPSDIGAAMIIPERETDDALQVQARAREPELAGERKSAVKGERVSLGGGVGGRLREK